MESPALGPEDPQCAVFIVASTCGDHGADLAQLEGDIATGGSGIYLSGF